MESRTTTTGNQQSRSVRVLGDIGNRLKKNLGTEPAPEMKQALNFKQGALKMEKAVSRPIPSKGGLGLGGSRQENTKPLRTSRTLSVVGGTVGVAAAKKTKPKVLGLQNKGATATSFKESVLKSFNAISSNKPSAKPPAADEESVVNNNRNNTDCKVQESDTLVSEIKFDPSKDVPTNEVFNKDNEKKIKTERETNDVKSKEVETVSSGPSFEILDIDAVDEKNPLLLKEYVKDICDYMFALEKKYPVMTKYLEGRLVNSKMRAVLTDWLIEVHYQFGFTPETLYIASKTLDRYLQKERKVTRKQLQLVGVTAMYIAAKYEEVCTPTVVDFSAVSDNAFSAADVRHMEREILHSLEFDLSPPPAVFFLRRFSKAAGAPMIVHTMAKYIMELTLVDYGTCHLFPSEQAAASLALAMLVTDKTKALKQLWTPTLQYFSRVSLDALKTILTPVASIVAKTYEEPLKLKAIYNKYSRNRLSKVSLTPELKDVSQWKDRVVKELCG